MKNWYQMEIDEVLRQLEVQAESGLSGEEAARRLEKFGRNELEDRGGKSPWKILLEQLTGIMTIVLIVSAVISLFLNDYEDAVAILAIVVLNTILGFSQEYRAEKAMAALKKMSVPRVKVRRGGHLVEIDATQLVPGDVVMLEAGNLAPADGRVIESANLRVQEAVLTGESEPIQKDPAPISRDNLSIGDQHNRIFMGTVITYGRGAAVITETGMQTELGKIATMLQGVSQEETPLQRRLEQVAKGLAAGALAVVAVIFALGLLRGEELRLMFLTAISMAVAAVPEGLPTVVTIGLALGAQRMLSRKALIRKLPAVETLGSVTVICSDKTGTLTENRMTVTYLDVADNQLDLKPVLQGSSPSVSPDEAVISIDNRPVIGALLAASALCNDAGLEEDENMPGRYTSIGDPTEGALVIAAARAGLWKNDLDARLPRTAELPFDSERKRMTTLHAVTDGAVPEVLKPHLNAGLPVLAVTKGSVDGLLEISSQVWSDGRVQTMDEHWRERIRSANNRLASNGMRVLGVAYQLRASALTDDPAQPLESGLIFLGLIGMIDPARSEVYDAVKTARSAGIRPIMITGDHPLTALSIARDLGITDSNQALTGQDLSLMSVDELAKAVKTVAVFARVSPEHKLKIVDALQANGQIVAMTGDGVNDAPALKKADIGVAMGITGTDVTKESADMVLLDDNFATIVAAVEEGRRIYDNIRKFIKYALGSNTGEILTMLVAPFLGMPLPLLPLQILWINLLTDGLPGLALTVEKAEGNVMERPPYHPKENVFSRGLGRHILWVGALLGAVTLGVGYWGWSTGQTEWQTMAFTTLTLAQMGHVLAIRSSRESLFKQGLLSNRFMLWAVLATIVLQMAVIYVPFLQNIFETVALDAMHLAVSLGAASIIFFAVEIEKWLGRRGEKNAPKGQKH